jgi:hypothetical protein
MISSSRRITSQVGCISFHGEADKVRYISCYLGGVISSALSCNSRQPQFTPVLRNSAYSLFQRTH